MHGIWIYSEDISNTRQLLTAGRHLRESLNQPIGVITRDTDAQSSLVALGADQVIVLKGESSWPESYADEIARIFEQDKASVLIVSGTLRGKDLAAKVAASLDVGLVTDAQSIKVSDCFIETTRLMYGGLAVCTEQVQFPAIVTIPPRSYEEPQPDESRQGNVTVLNVSEWDTRVTVNEVCPIVCQGVDISTARRIVCVGRGIEKQEDLTIPEGLAKVLGAEVACTRGIAEDYHWLPEERYIGISGQKVKPELYIAMGVSGQVQHLAGIRESKVIVAIDTNEKAPIFEAADYGIVGNLYEVVPLLIEKLQK
jgi:electron transfer flavoprotein alpha subunit